MNSLDKGIMSKQRITSGSLKNRPLVTADGVTRPLTDRIKLAIISTIQGFVEGAKAMDLFAGSGGFGFELISRGAREVTFVELSGDAMNAVRRNASELGVAAQCKFALADVIDYLTRSSGVEDAAKFDIIFADPPFPMPIEEKNRAVSLAAERLLNDGVLVFRYPIEDEPDIITPAALQLAKQKKYGRSIVCYFTHKPQ